MNPKIFKIILFALVVAALTIWTANLSNFLINRFAGDAAVLQPVGTNAK